MATSRRSQDLLIADVQSEIERWRYLRAFAIAKSTNSLIRQIPDRLAGPDRPVAERTGDDKRAKK
jgi:hypothetical protein